MMKSWKLLKENKNNNRTMIMRKLILLLPLALVLVLSGCEKIIEPGDLPEQDPMIVVNSIISTDQSFTVQISQSKSIISGKDYKFINNAVCELFEDGVFLQNLSFANSGMYYGSAIPKANKKYTLKVAASGFESVSASTSMPADIEVKPIERNDTSVRFYKTNYGPNANVFTVVGENRFRVKIVDDTKAINYYSISPSIVYLDSTDQPIPMQTAAGITLYGSSGDIGGGSYSGASVELDDKKVVNGNEIVVNVGVYLRQDESPTGPSIKKVLVFLKVQALSKDYYQYKETLLNQTYTGPSLFAEPVQVYNNVEKGVGILAGINTTLMPASEETLKDN